MSAGLLISLLAATSSATAKKQKPTETEPQEDTTLPEWAITDTITNKNINYGSDQLFTGHQFSDLFLSGNSHIAGLLFNY